LSNKKNDTSFVYHLNNEGDTIMRGYYRNGLPIGTWYLNKKIDYEFNIDVFLNQKKNKEYNSLLEQSRRSTTFDSLTFLIIKNEGVKALSYEKYFTLFEHGLKNLTPNGFYFKGEIDIAKFLKLDEKTEDETFISSDLGILNSLIYEYGFLSSKFANEEEEGEEEYGDDEIERPDERFNRDHINREMKSLGFK
ncbi:MAG: hypothetical protein P8I93_00635, partial [Crocinitomicaceae bacterium]|nr:hypothetical protein [Crocinitomicaceae bacterium]